LLVKQGSSKHNVKQLGLDHIYLTLLRLNGTYSCDKWKIKADYPH
jgi:hypothetical protein